MGTHVEVFEHASAMPAVTWRFLGANDARIEIPAGLHNVAEVKVEGDVRTGEADALECALADAQAAW